MLSKFNSSIPDRKWGKETIARASIRTYSKKHIKKGIPNLNAMPFYFLYQSKV